MKENTNPFLKQIRLLRLYNSKDPNILTNLFREIKDNKLLRTLFHIIAFDIGSIVNRVIDGDKTPGENAMQFENINNVMFTNNFNLNQLEQVFRKLNDLEAVDIYTEIESLFNNSRYNLVKSLVI